MSVYSVRQPLSRGPSVCAWSGDVSLHVPVCPVCWLIADWRPYFIHLHPWTKCFCLFFVYFPLFIFLLECCSTCVFFEVPYVFSVQLWTSWFAYWSWLCSCMRFCMSFLFVLRFVQLRIFYLFAIVLCVESLCTVCRRISSCRYGPCIVVAFGFGLAGFPVLGFMCLSSLYVCFMFRLWYALVPCIGVLALWCAR